MEFTLPTDKSAEEQLKQIATVEKARSPHRWVISTIIIFLLILGAIILTDPMRSKASDDYMKRGDQLLLEKKFVSAEVEYDKALALDSKNGLAKERIKLCGRAEMNISELQDLTDLYGSEEQKALFEEANQFPKNENVALEMTKTLLDKEEYQLAIIPAKTATEMDQNYATAWIYLGGADLKAAKLAEISPEAQEFYLTEARTAFGKASELNPDFKSPIVETK